MAAAADAKKKDFLCQHSALFTLVWSRKVGLEKRGRFLMRNTWQPWVFSPAHIACVSSSHYGISPRVNWDCQKIIPFMFFSWIFWCSFLIFFNEQWTKKIPTRQILKKCKFNVKKQLRNKVIIVYCTRKSSENLEFYFVFWSGMLMTLIILTWPFFLVSGHVHFLNNIRLFSGRKKVHWFIKNLSSYRCSSWKPWKNRSLCPLNIFLLRIEH